MKLVLIFTLLFSSSFTTKVISSDKFDVNYDIEEGELKFIQVTINNDSSLALESQASCHQNACLTCERDGNATFCT